MHRSNVGEDELRGLFFWLGAAGVCTFALGLASVFLYLSPQIPSTDTYRHYRYETPLQIFTADQMLIGEFGERRLYPVALDDVPRHFLNALRSTPRTSASNDHAGIDLISLANDLAGLITSPDVRTGASTLTMQLAKIVSFSTSKSSSASSRRCCWPCR